MHELLKLTLRQAWRLVVFVVGTTVLIFGLILTVTPGPAFVVIPIGLAILATEFVWARSRPNCRASSSALYHSCDMRVAGKESEAGGGKAWRVGARGRSGL